MIERLALRTGGFVGTTAEQTLRSLARLLPGGQAPPRRSRMLRALPAVAGTALGLAAGAVTTSGRGGASRRPAPSRSSRSSRNNGSSRSSRHNGAARAAGAAKDLAQKSRDDLYQLARKAGI